MVIIFILLFIVIVIVGFVTYKVCSRLIKKSSETQKKIMDEYKTEEDRENALKKLRRKNVKKAIVIYLVFLIGLPLIFFPFMLLLRMVPHSEIKPIGSYELFKEDGVSYYGKHDYSIFCQNNGIRAFSSYKIFNKKNETVFETNSYERFFSKLEEMFKNPDIEKINFYGTCTVDSGYQSLEYALDKSRLIESYEINKIQDDKLIQIKTINGILIKIEYLVDDRICTCKGR